MAALHADVPDELYAKLEKLAKVHNISINNQIINLLEKALRTEAELSEEERRKMVPQILEEIRLRRESRPTDIEWPDSTELIREDRNR